MTFQELITTLADKGDFDTSIGSFAWNAISNYLRVNKIEYENDSQKREWIDQICYIAKSEYPVFQVLTPMR